MLRNSFEAQVNVRQSFLEVASEEVRLVALDLPVLDRFVIEERVQFHRLVRSRSILVLWQKQKSEVRQGKGHG